MWEREEIVHASIMASWFLRLGIDDYDCFFRALFFSVGVREEMTLCCACQDCNTRYESNDHLKCLAVPSLHRT